MAKMFEVTIQGTYLAQQIINRLTFVSDNDLASTATAFSLTRALGLQASVGLGPLTASAFHRFLQCQTDLYQITQLIVRNLFGPTDFYTAAIAGALWQGEIVAGADGDKPFVAAKIKTNRVNQDIRRGSLALTPPTEEMSDAAGVITAGYLTTLNKRDNTCLF